MKQIVKNTNGQGGGIFPFADLTSENVTLSNILNIPLDRYYDGPTTLVIRLKDISFEDIQEASDFASSLNSSVDLSKSTLIGWEEGETIFQTYASGNIYIRVGDFIDDAAHEDPDAKVGSIIYLNNSPLGTGYFLIQNID